MKNTILVFVSLLLLSCGASKSASNVPNEKTLKGEWQITSYEFLGKQGTYKAKMFNLDDVSCFKNSVWMFIPNNNTGKFTTAQSNSSCQVQTSRIKWSFVNATSGKLLQFKYVDNKNKPIDAMNRGYQLKIMSLDPNSMKANVNVEVDGSPFTVVLTFNKISENVNLK
jgi:major membrane immunogen (membrane-anchored lipoprotein)